MRKPDTQLPVTESVGRRALAACLGALLVGLSSAPSMAGADTQIERIEPANWWVGMKDHHLQLMVHGHDIADYEPELHYPGVSIESVERVANRNYSFINLVIDANAAPGKVKLLFKHGQSVIEAPYQLLAREKNSANRLGFSNADVLLNLVPDRFANGDPNNDNVAGFTDKLNRASDDAGRHGGDIKGIVDHLDYIAAMGYTAIWPTPLTENNQTSYWSNYLNILSNSVFALK